MGEDHSWMYNGWDDKRADSDEWVTKIMAFLDHAFSLSKINKVSWPCARWQNMRCLDKDTIALDLWQDGFVPHYKVWVFHGKSFINEEEEDYSMRLIG
jgi:hypothetical protein